MKKKLMGLFASVALMGSGMALADDREDKDKQTQSQSGTGGSGTMDTGGSGTQTGSGSQQVGQRGMADQMGGQQLAGRVVKSERRTIWVEHAGAIVPLKIDKNTQFTGQGIKGARDIEEGDQIRASFEVRETDNVARSIEKSSDMGQGGSGLDVLTPDEGINQPMDTLPPSQGGTGGSGSMDVPDINEAPDADTGEVLNPAPEDTRGDY